MTCPGIFPPPLIRVRAHFRADNETNEITDKQIIGILADHEADAR